MSDHQKDENPNIVHLPAPTGWPMVAALGIALVCAGFVTHLVVSLAGLIVGLRAGVGWFREVLPADKHEEVALKPVSERAQPVKVRRTTVVHLRAGQGSHRVRIPAEIHPYSSGVKGGIAGGFMMALVACAYGIIAYRSVWYPINLLAAAALPSIAAGDLNQLKAFNGTALIIAIISHGIISMLVGLMFAVLLPMLPSRRAAFWGSLTTPLLWSALVWATLKLINPVLDARIDWRWFIASQVAFGLTTGYVVHHTKMVETMQTWPLAARVGLEAPGFLHEKGEEE